MFGHSPPTRALAVSQKCDSRKAQSTKSVDLGVQAKKNKEMQPRLDELKKPSRCFVLASSTHVSHTSYADSALFPAVAAAASRQGVSKIRNRVGLNRVGATDLS